jgi:hypothetical protein
VAHLVPYYDVHNHLWKHGDAVSSKKTSRIVEIIISYQTISIDDGKIIGTSLAGLLQFLLGNNWNVLLLQLRHFRVNLQPGRQK